VYFSAKAFPAMVGAENANSSIPRIYPYTKLDLKQNSKNLQVTNPFLKSPHAVHPRKIHYLNIMRTLFLHRHKQLLQQMHFNHFAAATTATTTEFFHLLGYYAE
jgi:hypothetical protein